MRPPRLKLRTLILLIAIVAVVVVEWRPVYEYLRFKRHMPQPVLATIYKIAPSLRIVQAFPASIRGKPGWCVGGIDRVNRRWVLDIQNNGETPYFSSYFWDPERKIRHTPATHVNSRFY